MNEEKALVAMAAQGKPATVVLLNVSDLVLLTWHHTPKTKDTKKADKVQQWMAILGWRATSCGMVQANVGQKLVNSNILRVLSTLLFT